MEFPVIDEFYMDLPEGYVLLNASASQEIAGYLRSLRHRLEIQAGATRNRDDKNDLADLCARISEYESVLK